MSFIVIGTNYKYSPIEIREQLSFSEKKAQDALSLLKENVLFDAGVILSTCNRVEIYISSKDLEMATLEIVDFLSQFQGIDKRKLLAYLYVHKKGQALKHLLTVACGLDSLVLGETQILGQIKQAFLLAESIGFVNDFLKDVFHYSVYFAKKVHRQTKISEGKVSVGSLAIDFIKEYFGKLSEKDILIVGVGKVTNLVLSYLKEENPRSVYITNRSFDKAKTLADQIGASLVPFEELSTFLNRVDILITATASPSFILKKEDLDNVIDRNLLIVDLGLPRNVDPEIKGIENINLVSLEELDTVIKKNLEKRKQKATKVKEIIDEEVKRYEHNLQNWN